MTEVAGSLQAKVESLRKSAAANFDPQRLHYIVSLSNKAASQEAPVAALLEKKALRALEEFQQKYQQASAASATLLSEIEKEFPAAAKYAQDLQEQGQFPQLRKLARRLHSEARCADITALTTLLDQQQAHHADDPDSAPLDELLRKQEADLVNSLTGQAETSAQPGKQEELRAARRFRNSLVKLNADKVVTQAIAGIPEDCGPLNPQRLATRSLETMRDLSPHYLSRFVSYIDTLFWLENAEKSSGR